ncbi:MAG: hypothetical protein RI907_3838 [Pseudomonadota bacterium]|jgi:hypothetical protein
MHTLNPLTVSSLMRRTLAVVALGATSLAHAGGGVYVSVDVGVPGGVLRAVSAPYVVREPVYVEAPRVVYRPEPVVYEAPRHCPPRVVYVPPPPPMPHHHHHHHHRHEAWGVAPVGWWGGGAWQAPRMRDQREWRGDRGGWDEPRMRDPYEGGARMVDPREGRAPERGDRRDGHH